MNFDQMKLVDYFVGGLVCGAIGFARKVFGRVDPAAKLAREPRRIAILKFLGIGSILQLAGTVLALRERFPHAKLILVTSRENRAFCELLPLFDEIHAIQLSSPFALARDLARTVWSLRSGGLDLVLDFEFFSNFSGFFTALAGGRWSIGFATPKSFRNWIFDEVVSFDHGRHISDIFYKVARALGLPARTGAGPRVLAQLLAGGALKIDRAAEERHLTDLLAAAGWVEGRPTVVVNVNAGPLNLNRRWPIARFRELIEALLAGRGVQTVLIGAQSEAAYVAELSRALTDTRGVLDLSGRLDVRQLILLLARADLYLGNDSGPLHIAESCGTRTVSLFGPETPRLYGPRGPEHIVFYKELPCSPCLNVYNQKSSDCRDNRCLKEISVDEVATAIRPVVAELEARGARARADAAQAAPAAGAGAARGLLVRAASDG